MPIFIRCVFIRHRPNPILTSSLDDYSEQINGTSQPFRSIWYFMVHDVQQIRKLQPTCVFNIPHGTVREQQAYSATSIVIDVTQRWVLVRRSHAVSIADTAIGDGLSPLVKPPITQEQLRRYAEASGDFNPIHLDEEAAHRVGLDSVIAHGMLSMAFLGQFVQQQIVAIPGAQLISLQVRFANMVRLGDTISCYGIVKERTQRTADCETVQIECWAQNQKGIKVTTADAIVSIPLYAL